MNTKHLLRRLRFLAVTFVHDRTTAPQTAAELCTVVAGLNGQLSDDGKSLAFAVAALLAAEYVGVRTWCLEVLQGEINAALSDIGAAP